MARFDRQIATALRLIKKNGQLVQWRQLQRADDPSDPAAVIESDPVDRNVYICFLPVDKDNKEFINSEVSLIVYPNLSASSDVNSLLFIVIYNLCI